MRSSAVPTFLVGVRCCFFMQDDLCWQMIPSQVPVCACTIACIAGPDTRFISGVIGTLRTGKPNME